jgi:N-formylglutamate amidohydrolase
VGDSILLSGPEKPLTPLVVAIPHAGRTYPAELALMSRLGEWQLRGLEDRYSDLLAGDPAMAAHRHIRSLIARAWIDLNRSPIELDVEMVARPDRARFATRPSTRTRGGLGLIPRRIVAGDIWKEMLAGDDIAARIATHHRPYHDAIDRALAAALHRFGVAILIDLHSMPPGRARIGEILPHIVIGDLHGRSSANEFVDRAMAEAEAAGFRARLNAPYAGGHTLALHGKPRHNIHAIQVEIDRALYLDAALDQPGPGLPAMARWVARLGDALIDQALAAPFALAAE